MALYANPYRFAQRRYERYGPFFRSFVLGKKTAIMLSAEAQKYVLVSHQKNFLSRVGYQLIDPFFAGALLLIDGERHDQAKKALTPAFHGRNMASYLETINRVIDTHLDSWGSSGTRPFFLEAAKISFTLGTSLLLGLEFGAEYQRLLDLWNTFGAGMSSMLRLNLPVTTFGRALQARKQIDRFFRQLLTEQHGSTRVSIIRLLTEARDEEGKALSEEQIITHIRFLISGSYDSITTTSTWLLIELLRHPDILERVQAELRAGPASEPITLEDLRQKPLLEAMIHETLRLYPTSMIILRGVHETCEFGGYTIPGGWNVLLAPVFTQRLPVYFTEPERFDPDRFLAPRADDRAQPYAVRGVGAGAHACIGEGIARLVIKVFMIRLLRRYDLQLVAGQDLRLRYLPLGRPKSDVFVTYQRK